MQVEFDTSYKRNIKWFQKKNKHLLSIIEETIELLKQNKDDPRLKYKKINCKKNKNRYSIRVLNQSYRILLRVTDEAYILICVCDHDKYDYYNKNC